MPKFYCEYCGVYLTHSSPSGRKQHFEGRKHIQNKIDYYTELLIEAQKDKVYKETMKLAAQKKSRTKPVFTPTAPSKLTSPNYDAHNQHQRYQSDEHFVYADSWTECRC